jgi:homocysteine S-methyltransferase
VAVSVGPYGATLADGSEYHGRYGLSRQQLRDWHRDRLALLAASGADLLAIETIPSLVEAEALLDLLDEMPEGMAWMSFSCRDDRHLRHGEPFAEAVALAMAHPRVLAAGLNCTHPRYAASLLRAAGPQRRGKPLLAYPNRGERWDARARKWKEGSAPRTLAQYGEDWLRAGARLIGGCCRTRPEDIRALRSAVESAGEIT